MTSKKYKDEVDNLEKQLELKDLRILELENKIKELTRPPFKVLSFTQGLQKLVPEKAETTILTERNKENILQEHQIRLTVQPNQSLPGKKSGSPFSREELFHVNSIPDKSSKTGKPKSEMKVVIKNDLKLEGLLNSNPFIGKDFKKMSAHMVSPETGRKQMTSVNQGSESTSHKPEIESVLLKLLEENRQNNGRTNPFVTKMKFIEKAFTRYKYVKTA